VIWLQTPTVCWLDGGIISVSCLNVPGVNDVRQTKNTYNIATSAWTECLGGWDGYLKDKNIQSTRYWSNPSKID